jgi:hypothetical protein
LDVLIPLGTNFSEINIQELIVNVINNGFSNSRVTIQNKSIDILLKCLNRDQSSYIIHELIKTTSNKQSKVVIVALNAFATILRFLF